MDKYYHRYNQNTLLKMLLNCSCSADIQRSSIYMLQFHRLVFSSCKQVVHQTKNSAVAFNTPGESMCCTPYRSIREDVRGLNGNHMFMNVTVHQ